MSLVKCSFMGVFYSFNSLKNAMKPYSQMIPRTRMGRLLDYNRRVQSTPASVDVLKEWNLDLDRQLVQIDGHRLKPEILVFGEGRTHTYVFFFLNLLLKETIKFIHSVYFWLCFV